MMGEKEEGEDVHLGFEEEILLIEFPPQISVPDLGPVTLCGCTQQTPLLFSCPSQYFECVYSSVHARFSPILYVNSRRHNDATRCLSSVQTQPHSNNTPC